MRPIRVGLIGASLGQGWGSRAHVPALVALTGQGDVELFAVATTHQETADATASRYHVPHAFSSAERLIAHPDVDLVSVVVRVPRHFELVKTALAAGKHVYCEWPLGRNLAEAEELRDLAEQHGVHAMVGLQARRSPVLRYARALVADGFVGRVLSCDAVCDSPDRIGPGMSQRDVWKLDGTTGSNVFAIRAGHTLDALTYVLATSIASVAGLVLTRTTRVRVIETGAELEVTAPDQVVLSALLEDGAPAAIHVQIGAPRSSGFRIDIHGDAGTLRLAGADGAQTSDLTLRGATGTGAEADLAVPAGYLDPSTRALSNPAANVARAYLALADGIRDDRQVAPDFADAVSLHRLLETIQRASTTGQRQDFV